MFMLPEGMPSQTGREAPTAIYSRLVVSCTEFEHLRAGEPSVAFLMRIQSKVRGGKIVLGACLMPGVQLMNLKPLSFGKS